MSLFSCPNGHRWEGPPSTAASGGGAVVCPFCGAPTESLDYPGLATPGTGLPGQSPEMAPAVRAVIAAAQARPVDPAEHDQPRPTIPGYELLEELGRGGMGIVYKARQTADGRLVALKVIRKERLANLEAVRRFRREAQAAARLAHPNIVLVYDSDQAGDTHFLAMEYVDGITLQRLVEQSGPLPVAQACDYVRQIALGLQHAHEQALVHRDVKPANLMVARSSGPGSTGLVKVLDMGVARLYQLTDNQDDLLSTLTEDGAMLGTPDYIAPEQLENAHAADIRADLYSLGCTFHFLLTGQVPFPGGTLIQKLDKQRWATPAAVDQLRPEVPAGLAAVVRKLMAKEPADRYQTPGELAAALEQVARTGRYPTVARPTPIRDCLRLTGHTDGVWSVAFAPDGRQAVSGGKDRSVRLWDLAQGRQIRQVAELAQEVRSVAFAPDGRHAFAASGATVRLWELATGREVTRFTGHTDTIKSIALSPDGSRLVSGGDDKTLRVWDVQSGREIRRCTGHKRDVGSVVFARDGRLVLSGSADQTMRLWDGLTGREVRRFGGHQGQVLSVALSPDGQYALSGNFDTTLRLWDAATGRELRRFQGHKQMVAAVAFAPDSEQVLSGSYDHSLRLWDVVSARELEVFEAHASWVTCVAFAPDGRQALSGGADKQLCLWQVPS